MVSYFTNPNITDFKKVTVPLKTNKASVEMILGIASAAPKTSMRYGAASGTTLCRFLNLRNPPLRNVGDSNSNDGSLAEQPPILP